MSTSNSSSKTLGVKEEWRDIPEWEGYYQASSFGRIKSLTRVRPGLGSGRGKSARFIKGKLLKLAKHKKGYRMVTLCDRKGRHTSYLVHVLVLLTFTGPCPEGMQCRHFPDRDKTNNRIENLQWGTPEQNQADRIIHGTDNRAIYNSRGWWSKKQRDRLEMEKIKA
jgi:hypothetical protein